MPEHDITPVPERPNQSLELLRTKIGYSIDAGEDDGYPGDAAYAALADLCAEVERLREVLRELVDAGEPYVGDAFPSEKMTGWGLRLFNRWQAAMNDARPHTTRGR